jgi:predicted Ser/Thr protein kinase/tetratricopeptide (TPR) repeat protein
VLERLRAALAPEYDVEREIATGGMGMVFLGREIALDRPVAIKVLRPELATAHAAERFLREARILASVRHPHIVPVHRVGHGGEFFYYVMDFLDGETLADRLTGGSLRASEVLKLGRDLLDALEVAHDRLVVHRDIKPSNVFFTAGRAVLVDFGIAKPAPGEGPAPSLTAPGAVVGTVDYMPPEQMAGQEVTPRTDLYAVGMVLYEALTGRRWSILDHPDRANWSGVPRRVARVLRRGVAWAPDDRWPDAASFRRALWRTRTQPYVQRTMWLTGAGLVVGAAAVLSFGLLRPRDGSPQVPPAQLAIVPFDVDSGVDPKLGWHLPRLAALNLQTFPRITLIDPRTSFPWWDRRRAAGAAGVQSPGQALRTRRLVQGKIVARGESLEVQVFVLNERGVVTASPVVRGVSGNPEPIGHRIALELVLALRPDLVGFYRGSRDLSQRSVQALNAFLDGEEAFGDDDWLLAERRYRAALALDSSFALAQWRLANAQRWRRTPVRVDLRRLWERQRGDLSERDQLLIAAQLARSSAERFALYDTALARYPRDAYAALLYGSELLSRGALAGVPLESALVVLRRATAQDSLLAPAYNHLTWAAIRLGRRDEAQVAIAALHRLPVPSAEVDLDFTTVLDLAFASRFGAGGPGADPRTVSPQTLADLARAVRFALTFDVPEAQVAFGRALAAAPSGGRALRANGHEAQAVALVALGAVARALGQFDTAAALFGTPEAALEVAEWRVLLGALGLDVVADPERRRGGTELERLAAHPRLGGRAAWALAFAAQARGDTVAAARWRTAVERRAPADSGAARLALLLQGAALAARGEYDHALATSALLLPYDSAGRAGDPFARAALHIQRAEWLGRHGRPREAQREWLWHDNADVVEWPTGPAQAGDVDWALGTYARLRRARLALELGDRRGGCALIRRVQELWTRADARFAPYRAAADTLARECGR